MLRAFGATRSFDAEMFAANGALYVRPSDDSRVGTEADSRLIREADGGAGVVLQDDGPPKLEARL